MRTLRRIAMPILWAMIVTPAFGQSAPEGFRDLKWGAPQADVSRALPAARCNPQSNNEFADWYCLLAGELVNGVSVTIMIGGYDTGRVVGMKDVTVFFDSDEVPRILEAFESRYGRWTRAEDEAFVTSGGGRYPNAQWIWEFPNARLKVVQHGERLGRGQATMTLRAAMDEAMARQAARKRGAGKGL
jgi:hypothetical protein